MAATAFQRVSAALINLMIISVFVFLAEKVAAQSAESHDATRAAIALKSLLGLAGLFWLVCAHQRSSPGLKLMKLNVVPVDAFDQRISLPIALIRPLPFFIFGILLSYPSRLLPGSLAPVQFVLVLISSLLLAANCTPLWSGPNRFSLLDRILKTRVVRR